MEKGTFAAGRTGYFDVLRIVATFAVVILHLSAQNWYSIEVNSFEWNVFNVYDSMVRWSVPIFIMISGALFLEGKQPVEKIYKKNITRIVAAFVFWSFLYTIVDKVQGNSKENMIIHFLRGHYHMWFLFMIIGLYLIVPCLRKIVDSNFLTKYFLALSLVFAVLIPQCLSLLPYLSEEVSAAATAMVKDMGFHFTLGYAGYFVLGYYLNKENIGKKAEWIIYALGICGFIVTIWCSAAISSHLHEASTVFYGYMTLNVLLESIAVFVFFKKHCMVENLSGQVRILIQRLSKYSFGVYLVHVLVIEQMKHALGWNTLSFPPVLSVLLNGIFVFLLSLCVSALLNRIPVLRRYIV